MPQRPAAKADTVLEEDQASDRANLVVIADVMTGSEVQTRWRKNLVQARSFAELLEQALRRYQNRAIEAAQVIEELIALAKDMREADRRGSRSPVDRGGARLLRCPGDQRQRGEGAS